jgi:hypothetical protein
MNIKINNSTILAILFSLYIPIIPGFSLFFAHIFFLIWVFFVGISNIRFISFNTLIVSLLAFSLLILSLWTSIFTDMGDRFIQDTIKIFILIFSIIILSNFKQSDELMDIVHKMIILLPIVIIFYIIFVHDGSLFTYSNRFYLEFFGSPNVLGAVSGLSIIILLFFSRISRILKIFIITFYLAIIIVGFSRAAILGLTIALLTSQKGRYAFTILLMLISIVFVFLYVTDIFILPEWVLIKTGLAEGEASIDKDERFIVWNATFLQIFNSTTSFLFGNNPGGEIVELGYGKIARHPHNTFLFAFWAYGIIGFIFFLASIIAMVKKTFQTKNYRQLKISLFVFYLIIFLMDTHILAGQFLIIHIFVLSFLLSDTKKDFFTKTIHTHQNSCILFKTII